MKKTGTEIKIDIIKLYDSNYCYIIHNNKYMAVIDPGESRPILEYIEKKALKITDILLTHSDSDHIGGLNKILKVHPTVKVHNFNSSYRRIINQNLQFETFKTPGHTEDSCCFYIKRLKCLFTGDTLFPGICGKVRDRMFKDFHESLQSIRNLPEETKILPGHEYLEYAIEFMDKNSFDSSFYKSLLREESPSLHSTIKMEIRYNPFMTKDYIQFKQLRLLKDNS